MSSRAPEPSELPWMAEFFNVLRETGKITEACERAGVARSWVYEIKDKEPTFAQKIGDALRACGNKRLQEAIAATAAEERQQRAARAAARAAQRRGSSVGH